MAGNSGGPWGGGGGSNGGSQGPGRGDDDGGGRGKRPGQGSGASDIDRMLKAGQQQLRTILGGRGNGGPGGPGGQGPNGPFPTRNTIILGVLAAIAVWAYASFYTVKPEERSVELFLGKFSGVGEPGLNFAPWPFVTAEVIEVTRERTEDIGVSTNPRESNGLMLTTDENIVDIDFQVVWNISDPGAYLFNLQDPEAVITAVAESVMREIIAATELAPILNRDRGKIALDAQAGIQRALDAYGSAGSAEDGGANGIGSGSAGDGQQESLGAGPGAGVRILRVNLDKADPPAEVIDAFRDVQAAEQERDRSEREADAYANRVSAEARGKAAAVLEQAEAYRAQVVNEAQGEASRFLSVLEAYKAAPEVTRRRLYLETMEKVLGQVDKIVLDPEATGESGVLPYLPLDRIGGRTEPTPSAGSTSATGGN